MERRGLKNYDEPVGATDGNSLVPDPQWVVDAPFLFLCKAT
jgi:hypothetical protein